MPQKNLISMSKFVLTKLFSFNQQTEVKILAQFVDLGTEFKAEIVK